MLQRVGVLLSRPFPNNRTSKTVSGGVRGVLSESSSFMSGLPGNRVLRTSAHEIHVTSNIRRAVLPGPRHKIECLINCESVADDEVEITFSGTFTGPFRWWCLVSFGSVYSLLGILLFTLTYMNEALDLAISSEAAYASLLGVFVPILLVTIQVELATRALRTIESDYWMHLDPNSRPTFEMLRQIASWSQQRALCRAGVVFLVGTILLGLWGLDRLLFEAPITAQYREAKLNKRGFGPPLFVAGLKLSDEPIDFTNMPEDIGHSSTLIEFNFDQHNPDANGAAALHEVVHLLRDYGVLGQDLPIAAAVEYARQYEAIGEIRDRTAEGSFSGGYSLEYVSESCRPQSVSQESIRAKLKAIVSKGVRPDRGIIDVPVSSSVYSDHVQEYLNVLRDAVADQVTEPATSCEVLSLITKYRGQTEEDRQSYLDGARLAGIATALFDDNGERVFHYLVLLALGLSHEESYLLAALSPNEFWPFLSEGISSMYWLRGITRAAFYDRWFAAEIDQTVAARMAFLGLPEPGPFDDESIDPATVAANEKQVSLKQAIKELRDQRLFLDYLELEVDGRSVMELLGIYAASGDDMGLTETTESFLRSKLGVEIAWVVDIEGRQLSSGFLLDDEIILDEEGVVVLPYSGDWSKLLGTARLRVFSLAAR